MSCHYAGIITRIDEIRGNVLNNTSAFPDAQEILALYPPNAEMTKLFKQDTARFEAAVTRTGGRQAKNADDEPIYKLSAHFEGELDLNLAAAEAGIRPEELTAGIKNSRKLGRVLGPLLKPDGKVKRDAYREVFGEIVGRLVLGTFLPPKSPS